MYIWSGVTDVYNNRIQSYSACLMKFELNHAICNNIDPDQIASPFVIDPKKLKEKDVDTIIVEVNNIECVKLKLLCKYMYCCSLRQWWKEEKVLLGLEKR